LFTLEIPTHTRSAASAVLLQVRWPGILGRLGDALHALNPDMPIVPNETSKIKVHFFVASRLFPRVFVRRDKLSARAIGSKITMGKAKPKPND
jgi:hypothetical protein